MNSEKNGSLMKFTEDHLNELEDLAALNYSVKQIALYFDIPPGYLQNEINDPDSVIHYHYHRGQLVAHATIDRANIQSAKTGNITATIRYDKRSKEIKYQQEKERILKGS
jgi:hypothetical protein